ncbi:MAG: FGGY-family carbohydrate kinase [Verrucomicrobiota bacterium]|jgi:xylulokinase
MLLGLDLGTTNVKALVTDRAGRAVARGSCPVQLFRLRDGGVEQDLEEIWGATLTAIRQAVQQVKDSEIKAIGISSQGGAMQVFDAKGNPLGRVISWLDQRGRPFDEALNAELGREWFLERIVHGGSWLCIGQVLRLRKEQCGLVDAPNRLGFVGDSIVCRLCGQPAQDGTSAALTLFYNPQSRTYDPDLLERLGLEVKQFPALMSARETAGGLAPAIAQTTGLRAGIPVSPAIHDQYASALGTGAVRAGTVMVGTGTAWVLLAVGNCLPVPVNNDTFVCHHVIDGLWGQILSMVNGGSALTWALETTGLAGRDGNGIDQLLESSPPGSEGLRFWPFLTPFGASGLAPAVKGRLSGLQLCHRAPHLIRAVVEGLALELNRHLDFVRHTGQVIEQLVMGGGAAASRVTPQLLADVTGLPLRCGAGSEASLVGAAIVARGLLEPGKSLPELAESMMPAPRRVHPGTDAPFYQAQYREYLASLPLAQGIGA